MKKKDFFFYLFISLLFLAFIGPIGYSCKDSGTPDRENVSDNNQNGGGKDGDGNGGDDGGDGGGNQGCQSNDDCDAGLRCDTELKRCIQCKEDYECPGGRLESYCDTDNMCKRRKSPCEPCSSDKECGTDKDKCVDGYCGKDCSITACPSGMICDSNTLQCKPQSGSCETLSSCSTDEDCPEGEICDTSRGLCLLACTYDEATGLSNCPNGETCHYNGRCGPVCQNDNDCNEAGIICLDGRCRPEGCLNDIECENEQAPEGHIPYCDTQTYQCITDVCRDNQDCKPGYECDQGSCRKLNCLERGGQTLACFVGQFCCGENPQNQCPQGVSEGECFYAPEPYCKACTCQDGNEICEANDQCGGPSYGSDHYCITHKDQNDQPVGSFCGVGCDPNDPTTCPRGYECIEIQVSQNGQQSTHYNCVWYTKCQDQQRQ